MDTPDKSKNNPIPPSVKPLEDSPVLSFMNSLSPIKPVKSVHITQTINPLTLASLQSVFTSPHATPLKESRFNQRHQLTDDWNTVNKNKANVDADDNMVSGSLVNHLLEESETMESKNTNGDSSITNTCGNMDYQHLSGSYAAVRKRCLVFDPQIPENDSSQCLSSGIGLHLNALPGTPNPYNIPNNNSSFPGSLLIGLSPFSSLHHPPPLEIEFDGVSQVQDSAYMENEETDLSTPRKRKRRLELAGDSDGSCKRCSCKKSKCLKLYCECFAAGVYCVEPCMCIDCFNKPVHEALVLSTRKQIESRNPLAFAPKVISSSQVGDDLSQTPASARHKRGCNCKKSGCLKKYCECYQGGVGCSINCRCEGCKNAFGTKDGSCALRVDHDFEEDETNTIEKAELNRSFPKTTIQDSLDQAMGSELAETRQLAQSFFLKKMPSTPSLPSSSFPATQGFGKSSFFQLTPKYSHLPETIEEDEMIEFLLEGSYKSSTKLTSSPNGKRVLSPQSCPERSSGLRSSRKLILQSISSFPSIMHNH